MDNIYPLFVILFLLTIEWHQDLGIESFSWLCWHAYCTELEQIARMKAKPVISVTKRLHPIL